MVEKILTDLADLKSKLKSSPNYKPEAKKISIKIVDSVIMNISKKVVNRVISNIGRLRINSVLNNINKYKFVSKEHINLKIDIIAKRIIANRNIDEILTKSSVNQLKRIKTM